MSGGLVVIGDALLDRDVIGQVDRIAPDAPVPVLDELEQRVRPGGAGLAAALAARDGHAVTLITALAGDEPGRILRGALAEAGVEVVDLELAGSTPEKIRLRHDGRPLLRLDRGAAEGVRGAATAAARAAIGWAGGVLVSDYGRGLARQSELRDALEALPADRRLVWDPHPRGPAPVPGVTVATPNEAEAALAAPTPEGSGLEARLERAMSLRARWGAEAVCVTRGAAGALLVRGDGAPLAVPARPVPAEDACGAGDRFASRLAGALADGRDLPRAVGDAVASATAFVAAGGAGSALDSTGETAPDTERDRIELVRSRGGTVVATGGCFDLLHAGHVRTLEAARALGDCLVVCVNSDASVRRLKGPGRPLVSEGDRASVLGALGCVDAVRIFDEDTPERVLEEIRPDVWVKGGDYREVDLPEAHVLRRWGGRALILPYVEGHSTTRLIEEAACRA
jgi:D-beta-D-heptose 7-phosphate kinase / D-beta-D-heptose 1-phosphate adenosyltransferase